jgi:class 3 adenylate cyclase
MSKLLDGSLSQRAREALSRHAWREAYDLMAEADRSGELTAEELEILARSAWWTGHPETSSEAWERAHAAHLREGDKPRAAAAAASLAFNLLDAGTVTTARAWIHRGARLLADVPEGPVHGYLAAVAAYTGLISGDLATAEENGRRAVDLGTRFDVPDVLALGLHTQGRAAVADGRTDEGLALIDEATAAAVSGELDPLITGGIYCSTVSACWTLTDYRRASEWTDAAERWCRRRSINGFPGLCRVHRAQIMKLRGAWREAEGQALLATRELSAYFPTGLGRAFTEIGEIRMRAGDLAGAEEAFLQAHEAGGDPQPGLALLRLARGDVAAAAAAIRDALENPSQEPTWDAPPNSRLQRTLLLPAQVEIAVAAGDLDTARAAADELESLIDAFPTDAMRASAAAARGMVQLAEGDAAAAQRSFQQSVRLWQQNEAVYEAARARMSLAEAYRAAGNEERAVLELRSALSTFDRLGAGPDAHRAAEALGDAAPASLSDRERVERTFMFTDIVGSTSLLEALGDEAWQHLIRWHDEKLRELVAVYRGEVVKGTGDGIFATFPTAAEGMECAVAIQRALDEHRRAQGFAPQVRIGLHTAEASRDSRDYQGIGVNAAARIGALAGPDEILVSAHTVDLAGERYEASDHRSVELRGISEPVGVAAVRWR